MNINYNVRSQKAYDALMQELEDKGNILWVTDRRPTEAHKFDEYKSKTVIFVRNNYLTYESVSEAQYDDSPLYYYKPNGQVERMITVRDNMKQVRQKLGSELLPC